MRIPPLTTNPARSQLGENFLLHGHIAWHSLAFLGIAWRCLALLGIAWHCLALLGIAWQCLALHGIAWHCLGITWRNLELRCFALGLRGIALHCLALRGIALRCLALHGIAGNRASKSNPGNGQPRATPDQPGQPSKPEQRRPTWGNPRVSQATKQPRATPAGAGLAPNGSSKTSKSPLGEA